MSLRNEGTMPDRSALVCLIGFSITASVELAADASGAWKVRLPGLRGCPQWKCCLPSRSKVRTSVLPPLARAGRHHEFERQGGRR